MGKITISLSSAMCDLIKSIQGTSDLIKNVLLLGISLLLFSFLFIFHPIPQNLAYHKFSDNRGYWEIPNFLNVSSNIPFVLIGISGLVLVRKKQIAPTHKINYTVLYSSILLTGFSSAFYHLHPSNNTLLYDRIPLSLIFMSFLSIAIAECINEKLAINLLVPLLLLGIGSVLYWYYTELLGKGDLRLYVFVQFYPVIIIPIIGFLYPSNLFNKGLSLLFWIIVTYGLAKLCEHYDTRIYAYSGWISGHTAKHLIASFSSSLMVKMYKVKYLV